MAKGGYELRPRLEQLGRPTIVVARIELSDGWRTHAVYPSLDKVFVGRLLELEDLGPSGRTTATIDDQPQRQGVPARRLDRYGFRGFLASLLPLASGSRSVPR